MNLSGEFAPPSAASLVLNLSKASTALLLISLRVVGFPALVLSSSPPLIIPTIPALPTLIPSLIPPPALLAPSPSRRTLDFERGLVEDEKMLVGLLKKATKRDNDDSAAGDDEPSPGAVGVSLLRNDFRHFDDDEEVDAGPGAGAGDVVALGVVMYGFVSIRAAAVGAVVDDVGAAADDDVVGAVFLALLAAASDDNGSCCSCLVATSPAEGDTIDFALEDVVDATGFNGELVCDLDMCGEVTTGSLLGMVRVPTPLDCTELVSKLPLVALPPKSAPAPATATAA